MPTSQTHRAQNWALLAGMALLFVAVDQVTKWLVMRSLAVNAAWAPIPALSRIFTITHVQNTGVAFGSLHGLGWVFLVVNVAVSCGVLVYYPRMPSGQWPLRLASALILAGAAGNMIDRVRSTIHFTQAHVGLWDALSNASVTDMFDFKFWWVFNIADLCVVSGVIIVASVLWLSESKRTATEAAAKREDGRPASET